MWKSLNVVSIFVVCLLLVLLASCGGGSSGSEDNDNGIIDFGSLAFWTFDETIGATAFNGAFPALHGNVSGASRVAGLLGNAYDFSANLPSYIAFPLNDSTGVVNIDFASDEFSMSVWVNINTLDNLETYFLFGNRPLSGIQSFRIDLENGDFSFKFFTPASNGSAFVELVRSNFTFNTGVWYNIAFTLDGNGATVYINGMPNTMSGNIVFDLQSVLNTLYLGGAPSGVSSSSVSFPGIIDELRFSEITMTPQQIEDYYNLTKP